MIMIHPKFPTKAMIVMAKKVYRKKLTNSGGGVCFLTCLAMIFALCAAAADFIAGVLYTQFYTKQVYDMTPDPIEYIKSYSGNIAMAIFAVIMFVKAAAAAKRKTMSKEFGWTGIFMSLALCLAPASRLFDIIAYYELSHYFETDFDSDKFRGAVEIGKVALPLAAGLLILITGLAVLVKLCSEEYVIEAPRAVKKKSQSASQPDEETDAYGFGENTQNVQGLTGETKPATYGSSDYVSEEPAAEERTEVPLPKEEKPVKRPTVHLCPKCGELVGEEELFCSNCGHHI